MFTEKIVDVLTGEEIVREYTKEQLKEVEKEQERAEKIAAIMQDRRAKRQSALAKLMTLGLTEEEIAAL